MNILRLPKRLFGLISKKISCSGNVTIITGASSDFYESLRKNLLESIIWYEKKANVIIWNLGLENDQVADLQRFTKIYGGVKIINYVESTLSPHYAMARYNYAFKSYCIYKSLPFINTQYAFWLDAGCGLRGPLDAERNILHMYGYYSPYSSTTVGKLTHPTVMSSFFNGDNFFADKQMLSGGVQGWRMDDYKALAMLSEWYNLTRLEDNIDPRGASLQNHRYDQSLLSLLYYSCYGRVPYLARYVYNIGIHLNR